jgi:hypothetical protein
VKFWVRHLAGAGVGLGARLAPDERVRRGEGRGVGRVLEEAPLAVEPPDVERHPGGGEEDRDAEGEQDEDLAGARVPSRPAQAGPVPRRRHQLITIVTSPISVIRPFASFGRKAEMIGTIRSWWYVARTVICWPIRVSLLVTPLGST